MKILEAIVGTFKNLKKKLVAVDIKYIPKHLPNYCKTCYINIINHFGGKNEHMSVRLFRLTTFFIAFITCLLFTINYYISWQNNPVMVGYENEFTDISDINFPAITMCYNSKVDLDKFDVNNIPKYIDLNGKVVLKNGSEFYLETLSHLCSFGYRRCNGKSSRKSKTCDQSSPCSLQLHNFNLNMSGSDYVKSLQDISILNFITELKFENEDDFFYEKPIYRRLMTEEGICYTINLNSNEELFTDAIAEYLIEFKDIDRKSSKPQEYPVRASKSGSEYGLTISTEHLDSNFNSMCTEKDGFKVMLHASNTYPRMSSHYIDIPADDLIMIAIKPFVVTTSDNLRKYSPQIRHCYFGNEKKLQFFRQYSQSNFEFECYIQRLMSTCGCVAFYMPHEVGTRICQSSAEKSCHCDFRENYGRSTDCDCLPSCNSVNYETEITTSKREATPENVEHVAVYFKKDYFLKIKRFEVFGWAAFWSSVGGVLGLLMGGSALSLIECFYNIFIKQCVTKKYIKFENDLEVTGKSSGFRGRSSNSCSF